MIDEEIRNIARPKNTILLPTKKENVYMVVERIGCKYDHGRRIPQNGKVIGHIIDKTYIPKEKKIEKLTDRSVSLLRYGNVAFADKMGKDLLLSLNKVYDSNDALNIYNLALMRASFGDIKDYQIDEKYHKSFASVFYPKRAVSKNSISSLLESIGLDYAGVHSFMVKRINDLVSEKTRILIDGMLKSNTSNINSFAGFSYKGRIKGTTDISIISAFDIDKKEPLCIKVYKGNLPDFVNCADFFDEFELPNGLVISDKGFQLDKLKERASCSKIAFLNPIKRSSKVIDELNLIDNMEYVAGDEKHILGKKANKGDLFYYSFLDINRESKEKYDYINGKKNKFDPKKFSKKKAKFGTVTFVSNLDLSLKEIYDYYALRWQIELVFKMYKGILSLNTTREHDNASVIGSEFINFLSVIITCRMKNKLDELGLLKKDTFTNIIDRLSNIIKTSIDEKEWRLCTLNAKEKELINELGI